MHPFRAFISLYSNLTDDDWDKIEPCLKYQIFQTNRVILKPGSICKRLYFLESGIIEYFIEKNNEEQITNQVHPPFLFTSTQSFTQRTPSVEGIRAAEESSLWIISRDDAYKLLELPAWNSFISNI